MHSPMWKTVPGGQATRKLFACNAHVGCKVGATVCKLDGSWVVKADLSEKHSSEKNLKARKNSALTQQQTAKALEALRDYTPRPKRLKSAADEVAEAAGAVRLPDMGVEGVCVMGRPGIQPRTA